MTNLKSQSGRSMVEMLGVLAIIGVLSIGGIAGYTMAMNRFRANEILDTAAKLVVIAQTKNRGECTTAAPCTANLDDIGVSTVSGLATHTMEASFDGAATTVTMGALSSSKVGDALDSVTGGTACGDKTSCTLTMADGSTKLTTATASTVGGGNGDGGDEDNQ